ncbi:MAG: BMP family ABC transporter substrate-binding protein, partial [Casimicrobium sp.]
MIRRSLLGAAVALVAAVVALPSFAQSKIKVAAIYTVPVEQQWVS